MARHVSRAHQGRRSRSANRRRRTRGLLRLLGYLMLYGVLAAGLSVGVFYGNKILKTHPGLAVDRVTFHNAAKPTERDLRAQLQWVIGRNMISLNLQEVRRQVTEHPRVGSAVIRGDLPREIHIHIKERQPAGLILLKNQVLVVAADGETIVPYNQYGEPLDMPVLEGLDRLENPRKTILNGLAALAVIHETSLLFWGNLETLNLADPHNMKAYIRGEDAPIYLGETVIPANIRNYLSIAHEIQNSYASLSYIELGFPNQVAVKPNQPSN